LPASGGFMGCDAILLDFSSRGYVASNQIVVIGFGACVVENVVRWFLDEVLDG
jgi:hypothetical protein